MCYDDRDDDDRDDDGDDYDSHDDGKGTPPGKKNVFFRALPKLPLPLPPIRATCTTFSAVKKEYIKCFF